MMGSSFFKEFKYDPDSGFRKRKGEGGKRQGKIVEGKRQHGS